MHHERLFSGRSLTTFKRDFAELYDTSPGKWLLQKRLEYSKYLLETTDRNIFELAFESGFENISHFIKVFRQTFGATPLQFKKFVLQEPLLIQAGVALPASTDQTSVSTVDSITHMLETVFHAKTHR